MSYSDAKKNIKNAIVLIFLCTGSQTTDSLRAMAKKVFSVGL